MTTSAAARPYHHGDLRRALLDAATEEIAAVGPSRLSLREVARRAGVSHAAPRHHFGDKSGLLTAIAAEGYRRLAAVTGEAGAAGTDMRDMGVSYVRFATANPAHFAVMFRPDLYDATDDELVRERDAAAKVLLRAVARALPDGAGEEELVAGVIAAWSMTHGFATLWLTRNLTFAEGQEPEELARKAFDTMRQLVQAEDERERAGS